MQVKNRPQERPKVIVRAWVGEPMALFLYIIENNMGYVGMENTKTAIGLPLEHVFMYDGRVFDDPRTAFDSGNTQKVLSIYSSLLVNSHCNRYRDILKSPHGKEYITDS